MASKKIDRPTADQIMTLLKLFLDREMTSDQLQEVFRNGHLVKALIAHAGDLAKVDRVAFEEVLASGGSFGKRPIPWTSPQEYLDRVDRRAAVREWRLPTWSGERDRLHRQFDHANHRGPFQLRPMGIQLWLGRTLEYNMIEALAWLTDELRGLGSSLVFDFEPGLIKFYPGCSFEGPPFMKATTLDLMRHWDPVGGAHLQNLDTTVGCPGLEVIWLLALNPQVALAMNGKNVPYMIAPGLLVGPPHENAGALWFMGDDGEGNLRATYDLGNTSFANTSIVTYAPRT